MTSSVVQITDYMVRIPCGNPVPGSPFSSLSSLSNARYRWIIGSNSLYLATIYRNIRASPGESCFTISTNAGWALAALLPSIDVARRFANNSLKCGSEPQVLHCFQRRTSDYQFWLNPMLRWYPSDFRCNGLCNPFLNFLEAPHQSSDGLKKGAGRPHCNSADLPPHWAEFFPKFFRCRPKGFREHPPLCGTGRFVSAFHCISPSPAIKWSLGSLGKLCAEYREKSKRSSKVPERIQAINDAGADKIPIVAHRG